MNISNLILRYSTEDSSRKTPLSEEMEIAAILCIAETKRKKPGLLGDAQENLISISKLHYPLWAIPWSGNCLLLDGVAITSNNILRLKPPDAENFIEQLRKTAGSQAAYLGTLEEYSETFSKMTSQTELSVEGFMKDKELLHDVLTYVQGSQGKTENSALQTSLIPPKVDKENAVKAFHRISKQYAELRPEIKGLQSAISTLNEKTSMLVGKLQRELEEIQEDFREKISAVTNEVNEKIQELEKERDEKIQRIIGTKVMGMGEKISEKKKLEKELLTLEQNKNEYKTRRNLRKLKKDKVGETRWNTRLRSTQKQISTLNQKIKTLSSVIIRYEKETEKIKEKLISSYEELISEEGKKILLLESSRDNRIREQNEEIQKFNQAAQIITDKIEKLVDQLRECSQVIEESAIPWKIETLTLINVPFYAIRYENGNKIKFLLRSPVIAQDYQGLTVKIRRTLRSYSLESRINILLKPRSRSLEKTFDAYEAKVSGDQEAERTFNQLCSLHNLLSSVNFKERISRGLGELEAEGWIKSDEKETILKTYATN